MRNRLLTLGVLLFVVGLALYIGTVEIGCPYFSTDQVGSGNFACDISTGIAVGGALASFAGIAIFFVALGSKKPE